MSYVNTVPMSFSGYGVEQQPLVQAEMHAPNSLPFENVTTSETMPPETILVEQVIGLTEVQISEALTAEALTAEALTAEAQTSINGLQEVQDDLGGTDLHGGLRNAADINGKEEKSPMDIVNSIVPPSGSFKKYGVAPWQPPDIVFKVVWACLYTLYFVILAKTWKSPSSRTFLLLGLALNFAWVPAFLYNPRLGLGVLIACIIIALITSNRLKRDGYNDLKNWFTLYIVWLFFALSINTWIVYNLKK